MFAGCAAGERCAQTGEQCVQDRKNQRIRTAHAGSLELNDNNPDMLAQFSVSESWVGDFSSGVIRLKERSANFTDWRCRNAACSA
jgi:hypothetical protein